MVRKRMDPADIASTQMAITRKTWTRLREFRTIDNRMNDIVEMLLDHWDETHKKDKTHDNTESAI